MYFTAVHLISPQGAPISGKELCDANVVPRSPFPAGSRGIMGQKRKPKVSSYPCSLQFKIKVKINPFISKLQLCRRDHDHCVSVLTGLRLWHSQQLQGGLQGIVLNPVFKDNLRIALLGG